MTLLGDGVVDPAQGTHAVDDLAWTEVILALSRTEAPPRFSSRDRPIGRRFVVWPYIDCMWAIRRPSPALRTQQISPLQRSWSQG
jgi:hypothetical protein